MNLVVTGKRDAASDNIFSAFMGKEKWVRCGDGPDEPLYQYADSQLFLTQMHKLPDEDYARLALWATNSGVQMDDVLMAAWHEGNCGACFMVHGTGDIRELKEGQHLGSRPNPRLVRALVNHLHDRVTESGLGYDVFLEATHGPDAKQDGGTFTAVEIGGSTEERACPDAGIAVADAIIDFFYSEEVSVNEVCLIGGGHLSKVGARIMLDIRDCAITYHFPKYMINQHGDEALSFLRNRVKNLPKTIVMDTSRQFMASLACEEAEFDLIHVKDFLKH